MLVMSLWWKQMMQTKTRTLNVTKFHTLKTATNFQTSTINVQTQHLQATKFLLESTIIYSEGHLTNPDIICWWTGPSIHPLSEASEAKFAARSRAERYLTQGRRRGGSEHIIVPLLVPNSNLRGWTNPCSLKNNKQQQSKVQSPIFQTHGHGWFHQWDVFSEFVTLINYIFDQIIHPKKKKKGGLFSRASSSLQAGLLTQ